MVNSYLHLMWIVFTFLEILLGVTVLFTKNAPPVIKRFYVYGKVHKSFLKKQHYLIDFLEVPKRWFSHFYIFGVAYFCFIVIAVLRRYYSNIPSPFLEHQLNLFGSNKREATVTAESVIIVSILLFFQVFRRCYECLFVSVFSDGKMNICYYICGILFYTCVGLSLLHDAPGFERIRNNSTNYISGIWITFQHLMGVVLFLLGFIMQFKTHKALASLRKRDGKVISTEHHLPTSGLFEYISCPHYFAEIVIYLSMCLILNGKSYSWWLVCLCTVFNQFLYGIVNHKWYKKTFKKYPIKRKAIIPFLI